MPKIFIDGSAGTTGLRIRQRLEERKELTLLLLSEEQRKDPAARREALNEADVAFLCLPDDAAREAVSMVENPQTVIIDTSTAHRTDPAWTYGFPELTGQKEKIVASKRIANPGCHAGGFISLVAPLVEAGVLPKDALLSCFSLTGYSGGGKKMIAQYEDPALEEELQAPRVYGLGQKHKHLPEMKAVCGLANDPIFSPVVSSYYAGMETQIPLFASQVRGGLSAVREVLRDYYHGRVVFFAEAPDEAGFMSAGRMAGRDDMEISVVGNEERFLLISRFDNLGKGASGAALQNMNLVLGADETAGLRIGG